MSHPGKLPALELPQEISAGEISAFAGPGSVRFGTGERVVPVSFFDTFDRDLRAGGRVLALSDGVWLLVGPEGVEARCAAGDAAGFGPPFPAMPGPGRIGDALAVFVPGRRLFLVSRATVRRARVEGRDADGKLVFRGALERYLIEDDPSRKPFRTLLIPQAVRGYGREARKLLRVFGRGIGACRAGAPPEILCYDAVTDFPPRDSLRPCASAAVPESADRAVCLIASAQLRAARRYESGIIDDIDSECLHRYRVNLRRLRSLFRQTRRLFADAALADGRGALGRMSRRTNRLRDCDVFLAECERLAPGAPSAARSGLQVFATELVRERRAEHTRLRRSLRSQAHGRACDEILRYLAARADAADAGARGGSDDSIRDVVAARIRRQYRKLRRAGSRLGESPSAAALHRLRIRGKELRYLLEIFAAFMPGGFRAKLEADLKALQDCLGRHHDLAILLDRVGAFGLEPRDSETGAGCREAAMYLEKVLSREERRLRRSVPAKMAALCGDRGRRRMRRSLRQCRGTSG